MGITTQSKKTIAGILFAIAAVLTVIFSLLRKQIIGIQIAECIVLLVAAVFVFLGIRKPLLAVGFGVPALLYLYRTITALSLMSKLTYLLLFAAFALAAVYAFLMLSGNKFAEKIKALWWAPCAVSAFAIITRLFGYTELEGRIAPVSLLQGIVPIVLCCIGLLFAMQWIHEDR